MLLLKPRDMLFSMDNKLVWASPLLWSPLPPQWRIMLAAFRSQINKIGFKQHFELQCYITVNRAINNCSLDQSDYVEKSVHVEI